MIEIPLVDRALQGGCSISGKMPTRMRWITNFNLPQKFVVFLDRAIDVAEFLPVERKIAMLVEPRQFVDEVGWLTTRRLLATLDYVLTYDRTILRHFGKKALWYPIGGCWIPDADQHLFHRKDRVLSIIASGKKSSLGHRLRHEAVEVLQGKVDVYGRSYKPIEFKTEALAPYMFSIAIENGRVESMFTEKIIDCFVTGTVPIYYGCNTIGDYFNPDGILEFDTRHELEDLVPRLTPELYDQMRPAIEDNFNRAKKYLICEDWICEHYPFLFV